MTSHRRSRSPLACTSLEPRLTPAQALRMGPLLPEGYAAVTAAPAAAAGPFRVLDALPASSIKAAPDFRLTAYSPLSIDIPALTAELLAAPAEANKANALTVSLPAPDGGTQRFNVWEVSIMEPGLAAQFPNIHTWRGQGIDDPAATLAADVTQLGFHAQVRSPSGSWYVDPYYHLDDSAYVSYSGNSLLNNHGPGCGCAACLAAAGVAAKGPTADVGPGTTTTTTGNAARQLNGETLRQYRLAVAATGEYSAFQGGTVAKAQAAIVTAVNRVDGVYETELSIRMVLVANNTSIVYTSTSDPYTNGNPDTMIDENQANVTSVIGSANFDIGHVFGTNSGGLASRASVGVTSRKAMGVTGSGAPVGDAFYIDYVAHEMGHQFGANHTFNGSLGSAAGNRAASVAYEPGSGSTIMAYAGICGADDLQAHSDVYFHAASLDEISSYTSIGVGAGNVTSSTGNSLPVADAKLDYVIPARTPFALTGSATDANGSDSLTYCWEEYDLGGSVTLGTADNGTSPLMRSYAPTASPTRTVPQLSYVLANTTNKAEVLPTTSRTLNFRLTARDNRAVGAFDFDDTKLTVVDTGTAFALTSQNAGVSYTGGSTQTVTWTVAGTSTGTINAALVNILLSTDGGQTFTTTLASGVANDGSETVVIPNTATTTARVKVQPTNNIFFDINNSNFSITAGSTLQVASVSPTAGSTLTGPTVTLDVTFNAAVKASTVGTDDLTLSVGTVTGAVTTSGTTVRYTIGGLTAEGALTITLPANAVTTAAGAGNGAYTASYNVDAASTAFPTLSPVAPLGSGVFQATATGTVNTLTAGTDVDEFTVALDAGQSFAATLTPAAGLQPRVTVLSPTGTTLSDVTAAAAGKAVTTPAVATTAGTYTVRVQGTAGTTGTYSLRALLNAVAEGEGVTGTANNAPGTAQSLTLTTVSTGMGSSGRASVLGATDAAATYTAATTTYNFENIATTGATILANQDDATAGLTIPFGFGLYGTTYTSVTVSSNGVLTFGGVFDTDYSNTDLASGTTTPALAAIAPYWDDLVLTSPGVKWQVSGTAPNRRLVVQWEAASYYLSSSTPSTSTPTVQFEALLYEGSNQIRFNYANLSASAAAHDQGVSATTGVRNADGSSVLLLNYNAGPNTFVGDGKSALVSPPPPAEDWYSFTGAAGQAVSAVVSGLATGTLNVAVVGTNGTTVLATGAAGATNYTKGALAATLPAAGTYYVRVTGDAGVPYDLSLVTGATFDTEANNTAATAQSLAAGATFGNLTSGDADWYSVTVPSGVTQFTAQTRTPNDGGSGLNTLDPALTLFASNGTTQVAAGTALGDGRNESLAATGLTPGATYLLRVTAGGTTAGDYFVNTAFAAAGDVQPPTATTTLAPVTTRKGATYQFVVTLADDTAVSAASVDGADFTVTGPNGYSKTATLVSLSPTADSTTLTATLTVPAPGGTWDVGDNGTYTVSLTGSVTDKAGNGAATGSLGTFAAQAPVAVQAVTTVLADGTTTSLTSPGQRSLIPNIKVTYDGLATGAAAAAAYQLVNTTTNATVTLTASTTTVGGKTVATLTPPAPLADGYYTLTVLGTAVTTANLSPLVVALDGDNNGTAGGNYGLDFLRFLGDADGDGAVDGNDLAVLAQAFNSTEGDPNYLLYMDLSGDGAVDGDDLAIFAQRFNTVL